MWVSEGSFLRWKMGMMLNQSLMFLLIDADSSSIYEQLL